MQALEVAPGILAGRLIRPLSRVGCYIPGGLASYPSSALMTIIPAQVAGVKEIIACTPPGPDMKLNPATVAAAHLAGAGRLFKLGGPWAVGSMAYGTGLVPQVDKIVGPGNKYVTAAKLLVFGEVDIDSPAGPSEALILADETAEARLVAAHLAGAQRLFKIGGPWAIGSLAYGTALVPKVDKIVGPGNKYVTAAKLLVFGTVDIDSPAGPSEALILADETAEPRFVAMDFLSQVEHDPEAAAVLVTPSAELAQKVVDLIITELPHLPRREIIEAALGKYSAALVAESLDEAVEFANLYAAEHLQIVTLEPFAVLPRIRHAGSIFLGPYAPVPVGDYASGTNHVLPTGGCARMFSGLSVDDFIKKPTFQHLSKAALASLKDTVITLAESEGLLIHARAVAERFRYT